MMGLFDTMFGGAGVYKDMLDPETMRQVQQQSQLAMAAQLLAAGGPSTSPTSLGQALGKGVMAGQQAQQGGVTNAVQGMLMKQKMDEYKRQTDYLKALRGQNAGASMQMPKAAPMTSGQSLPPAVVPGLPIGPTNARAAQIGRPPVVPKLSDQDRQYNDLMKKYELSNQYGMVDEAGKYFDRALKIKPTPKITGQPFEVTDASGKPIMVQQYDNGEIKTMAGFGPKRNVTLQNVGDKLIAVDMANIAPGAQLQMGMDPGSAANLGLSKEKFNWDKFTGNRAFGLQQQQFGLQQKQFERGGFDLVNTPSGSFYVPKPGVSAAPGMSSTPTAAAPMDAPAAAPTAATPTPSAEATNLAARLPAPTGTGNQFLRPAGAVAAIPILGPDGKPIATQRAPEAFSKAQKQLADMRQSLGSYKKEVGRGKIVFPGSIPVPFTDSGIPLPQGADSAAMTAKYTAMTMGLKNLYELGALAGPDMALLERQMTNPASFKGWLTSAGGLNEQIQVIEDMLDRAEENLSSSYNMPFKPSQYKKSLDDIFKPTK
jgi:hypothetical protein